MEEGNRPVRWLTNCSPLVNCEDHGKRFICETVPDDIGGLSRLWILFRGLFRNQVAVIHQSGKDIVILVIFNKVFFRGTRKIVGIDFQFARPEPGKVGRLKALVWKWAWSNVNLVIAHMRFIKELNRFYGITEENFMFVPFKINGFETIDAENISDEGYVFTGGYSRRDYRTFCAAMAMLPDIPAKLVTLNPEALRVHGVNDKDIRAPQNVEVIRHDQNPQTWQRFVGKSRCVVIPISEETICSNGISVCLNAMGLRKPVVISRSPAVDGIFESGRECVIVDFKDPEGTASAIRKLWDDTAFREQLAEQGYSAAKEFGGVNALMERIAQAVLASPVVSSKAD
ncbi:glycosyltransferase [Marinobacter halotolerans]|uniref:glycosyltransferase n=1 Tax=Marinobacter halotolerans TaxID=1569211 RepID=UPI0012493772|nr:glycosyltransferase [Marinobacter halotolerans]